MKSCASCKSEKREIGYSVCYYCNRWRRLKGRAKKKGLSLKLTKEQVTEIIKRPCHYCGTSELNRGLDRYDNSIGYLIDNVRPSCVRCNRAKNDMSLREWHEWKFRFINHQMEEL